MTEFITIPVETDPDALVQEAFDYIQDKVPNWEPSEGNLEVIILEAIARMAAEVRDVASDVPLAIFRYFGATLLGIAPVEATHATVYTFWTLKDTAGYTIPAGTLVGLRGPGDELVAFEVPDDVVVPNGTLSVDDVLLIAVEPGAAGSGLPSDPSTYPELIDPLDFLDPAPNAIQISGPPGSAGPSFGGVDAEEDEDYLNRLASELQLLAPRPILPNDFAVLSRRVPGVWRAIAIDGYNPTGPLTGQERMVTVAVIDADGEALSSGVKNQVDALLESSREVNFQTFVIDPTYTQIDVTFTAVAYPDWDIASVEAEAEAAVAAYLSPATWGTVPSDDERSWLSQTKVRYLEVAEVINKVPGVHYISALTIGIHGGSMGSTDVDLTGSVAQLPRPNTISGTVNAP